MKISTKGRYALNALIDIALNKDQSPIPLSDIAKRQEMSLNYLEQLFVKLRRKKVENMANSGNFRII